MQTRKPFVQRTATPPHPHFYDDVARTVTSDAPTVSSDLSPEMFALSVNRLNGRNLQPVQLEPLNGIDTAVKIDDMISSTENLQEQARQQARTAEIEEKLRKLNEEKEEDGK